MSSFWLLPVIGWQTEMERRGRKCSGRKRTNARVSSGNEDSDFDIQGSRLGWLRGWPAICFLCTDPLVFALCRVITGAVRRMEKTLFGHGGCILNSVLVICLTAFPTPTQREKFNYYFGSRVFLFVG